MTVHQGTRPVSLGQALAFNPNWTIADRCLIQSEIERLGVDGYSSPPSQSHVNLMRGSARLAQVTLGRIIYQPDTSAPDDSETLQWEGRYRQYRCVCLSTARTGLSRAGSGRSGSRSDEQPPQVCPSCFMALTPAGSCPSGCDD